MPNNSEGSYATTREAFMKAFDKLPETIRAKMRDSVENWVPQPVLTKYRKTGDDNACVRMIERWDNKEIEEHWYRMNRMLERGVDYHVPIRRRKK